jgi:Tol biopolymer transport system component
VGPNLKAIHTPEADVLAELKRLLESREFAGSERLSRFLRFVVERTLAGDRESLKESIIGTEVFDRPTGYDPKTEPIVRTEARRLRAKLDEYYQQPGRPYLVKISVPKGGYLAAFEPRPQPIPISVPLPAPEPVAPPVRPPSAGFRWIALAAAFAVLAAGILFFILRPRPPRSQGVQRTVTSYAGHQQQPALSPDGSQVAFAWGGERGDNRDIYVTMASGGVPRRVTTDPGADDFPAWSPDGSRIAFVRENKSLMLITPLGTNERRLTSAYDSKLSWTPDGKSVAFTDWSPDGGRLATFLVDVATGLRRQITFPGRTQPGDVRGEISPTGREVAFVRFAGGSCGVYRQAIGDREARLVWRCPHLSIVGITWSPDSRDLVFAALRGSEYILLSVPASGGGEAQVVPLTGEDNSNPSFSRSLPARLVWEHSIRDSNIWRLNLAGGPRPPSLERIVASTRLDSSPQLSPDGRSIMLVSDRTGTYQLWRTDADGRNPVQLTNYQYEYPGSARWSPDGARIVFDLRTEQGRALFVMDAAGGTPRQWTAWKQASRPSWSRDGRWIYYSEEGPDGHMQIWKIGSGEPRDPVRMTTGGGFDAFDSPDGTAIYYTQGQELWSIPASGGTPTRVLSRGISPGWWAVSSRGIFFVDLYAGGSPGLQVPLVSKPIYLLEPNSPQPVEVGRIDGETWRDLPDFTVSPDGWTVLFSVFETSTTQIRLLEGMP